MKTVGTEVDGDGDLFKKMNAGVALSLSKGPDCSCKDLHDASEKDRVSLSSHTGLCGRQLLSTKLKRGPGLPRISAGQSCVAQDSN